MSIEMQNIARGKKAPVWGIAAALVCGAVATGSTVAHAGGDEGSAVYGESASRASVALMGRPDWQSQAVLNQLKALKPKPIEKLSAAEARRQPSPPQAVKALLMKRGQSTAPEAVGSVQNLTVPGPAGAIPVRVYKPTGNGPFPVIVYLHGGGWVIAGIQGYDASARALTNAADAMVVSVGYRMAPEHKFPAAHEDSYAATQWIMKNAAGWGGDVNRVAIAGESAGGNLAAAVTLMARDRRGLMPIHQLLVYPIANYAFNTQSYRENAKAKPLNRPMMMWFFDKYLRTPRDGNSPYVSILRAPSLSALPPATVILAEIDPLRSEGAAYAHRLQRAGVPTVLKIYPGTTHEFFGMGAVVDKGKQAVNFAASRLKSAFAQ
ncbi:MAG TPA: alpha/beta hydrolase [Abditibacteriaceae bacterium]|jgi:acetyl esterase/lipase